MSRRCGSSKPTPTPLNGQAITPGKTRRKAIEGNADTIIRQTARQKPAAYRQCGEGARRKRRYGKTNHRQNLPAHRQRGGGGETKKGELKENTGAKARETNIKAPRRLPSWRGGGAQKAKTNTKMERHNPPSREGGEVPS